MAEEKPTIRLHCHVCECDLDQIEAENHLRSNHNYSQEVLTELVNSLNITDLLATCFMLYCSLGANSNRRRVGLAVISSVRLSVFIRRVCCCFTARTKTCPFCKATGLKKLIEHIQNVHFPERDSDSSSSENESLVEIEVSDTRKLRSQREKEEFRVIEEENVELMVAGTSFGQAKLAAAADLEVDQSEFSFERMEMSKNQKSNLERSLITVEAEITPESQKAIEELIESNKLDQAIGGVPENVVDQWKYKIKKDNEVEVSNQETDTDKTSSDSSSFFTVVTEGTNLSSVRSAVSSGRETSEGTDVWEKLFKDETSDEISAASSDLASNSDHPTR